MSPGSTLNPIIPIPNPSIPNPLPIGPNPILTIDTGDPGLLTGAGVASAGAIALKKKLKLLPLLAPLLKSGKKGSPKILAIAGGKAKVKIIVFPPIKKVNNEKTEVEDADDKVTSSARFSATCESSNIPKILLILFVGAPKCHV